MLKKILFITVLLFILLLVVVPFVLAADDVKFKPQIGVGEEFKAGKEYKVKSTTIGEYIAAFYKYFIGAIAILAVVMIMWGGFLWLTAAGNSSQIGVARTKIGGALIGLILALSSYLLLNTINPKLVKFEPLIIKPVERRIQTLNEKGLPCPPGAILLGEDPESPKDRCVRECGGEEEIKILEGRCCGCKTGCSADTLPLSKLPVGQDCKTYCKGQGYTGFSIDPSSPEDCCSCSGRKPEEKGDKESCLAVKNPTSQADCDPYSGYVLDPVVEKYYICRFDPYLINNCKWVSPIEYNPRYYEQVDCNYDHPNNIDAEVCWNKSENKPKECGDILQKRICRNKDEVAGEGIDAICIREKVASSPFYCITKDTW